MTLQEKLKSIGISGNLFSWLTDCMSMHQQFIQVSGNKSEPVTVRFGVPQGSILGPMLFSIFVRDLAESIMSGEPYLFADDTTTVSTLSVRTLMISYIPYNLYWIRFTPGVYQIDL